MATLRVTNLKGRTANIAPNLPDGANVTGVLTATSFVGSGSGLTGVASTDNIVTGTAATFTKQVDIDNLGVTGITTTGIATVTTSVVVGSAATLNVDGLQTAGVVTATTYTGSAANMTAIPAVQLVGAVPSASLTNVDLTSVRQDISKLALQISVETNRASYNLNDSFVDQFENQNGISTSTDAQYSSDEYWYTFENTSDSDIVELWTTWGSGDMTGVTVTGDMGRGTIVESGNNGQTRTSSTGKFETKNILRTGGWNDTNHGFIMTGDSNWNFGTGAFTFEGWVRAASTSWSGAHNYIFDFDTDNNGSHRWTMAGQDGGTSYNGDVVSAGGWNWSGQIDATDWSHFAIVRDTSGNGAVFIDGNRMSDGSESSSTTNNFHTGNNMNLGERYNQTNSAYVDFDQIRWSSVARYDPTQTTYTVPTSGWTTSTTASSATGTIVSVANTASSAQTKVSGVMLYTDSVGTATLGTDLKVSFTCDGGSNWSDAASYTAGSAFSSGVKTVYLGETTCTSGTDVRYKVEWANQADGTKVTHLKGMAINY